MQVERLRLVGFKSFADAIELPVQPGLTGIVGPNGCGKSNLAEALRWVMGETSARRLRGGEMDQLIFAGSARRPGRNLAEVALVIDNSGRDAPFAFNERESLEIVRRIERGGGSTYRINGREVRARDIQLLFADAATGAHSGAMVGQGRVAALIEAKPSERRLLLEEAAGTAGLHARRHESELRLKAAGDNLARLDDVILTLQAQLGALKKQARQAQRYRRLGEQIRRIEALLLHARWCEAEREAERRASELAAAESAVAGTAEHARGANDAVAAAESALPALRQDAAAAAGEAERLEHTRQALETELQHVLAARAETAARLDQIAADLAREEEHRIDAAAALDRLAAEHTGLDRAEAADAPMEAEAAARLNDATIRLAAAEAALDQASQAAAQAEARRGALERRCRELAARAAQLAERHRDAGRQHAALATADIPASALAAAAETAAEAERRATACHADVEAAERQSAQCQADDLAARDRARTLTARLTRLKAEADALEALLAPAPAAAKDGEPIMASLSVAEGFEAAAGALFDDALAAPLDTTDSPKPARFWRLLPPLDTAEPLPEGAHPLSAKLTAPPPLARRLGQAGWVADEETGYRLQPRLAPGQHLVDREGRLWGWDGFTRLAPGPSPVARHLIQRNRLAALAVEIDPLAAECKTAEGEAIAADSARQQAENAVRQARQAAGTAAAALTEKRAAEAELSRRALAAETRRAALADTLDKLAADLAETRAQEAAAAREVAALPAPAALGEARDRTRAAAAARRREEAEARAAIDRLKREAETRRQRREAMALEERSWHKRSEAAIAQQAVLRDRRKSLEAEIAALAARPAAIAAESEGLTAAIGAAAEVREHNAAALAAGESRLTAALDSARAAERAAAEAREQRARIQVLSATASEARDRLAREIGTRLGAAPDDLPGLAGLDPEAATPDVEDTAARLDRLVREREGIGPVNLMAESEAAELDGRIAELSGERADLTEAIARLRRGIAALEAEGRQRIAAAFARVDGHFTELFIRLFGGGRAHLSLIDDDDPLAAGLEIMASPPGKRLQSLTLLSGGEQALTALALLFAVFLTNPSPICVLDEVDTPLDDANVDRLCGLIGEIADTTGTRFLIVTHHRITMARMDRLFGVTMAERGISQLVSVDLAGAADLRKSA